MSRPPIAPSLCSPRASPLPAHFGVDVRPSVRLIGAALVVVALLAAGCAIPTYGTQGVRLALVGAVLTLGGLGLSRSLAGWGVRSIRHVGWVEERGWFVRDAVGHVWPFELGAATAILGGVVFLTGRTPRGRVLCVLDRSATDPLAYCALRRRLAAEC